MKRNNVYHVNKLCNKWEEENHRKNMERKIRSARSALPASAGAASAKRPASSKPHGGPPAERQAVHLNELSTAQLDELIFRRLQQVLGDPLLQQVQQQLSVAHSTADEQQPKPASRRSLSAGSSQRTTRPNSNASPAAAKPPRPKQRPQWNDDWAAPPRPPQPAPAATPPRTTSARSNPSPSKSQPQSRASPARQQHSTGAGSLGAAGGAEGGAGLRVQLLPSSPAPSCAQTPVGQQRPQSRYAPRALTPSLEAAITTLNPVEPAAAAGTNSGAGGVVPHKVDAWPPRPKAQSLTGGPAQNQPSAAAGTGGAHAQASIAPRTPGWAGKDGAMRSLRDYEPLSPAAAGAGSGSASSSSLTPAGGPPGGRTWSAGPVMSASARATAGRGQQPDSTAAGAAQGSCSLHGNPGDANGSGDSRGAREFKGSGDVEEDYSDEFEEYEGSDDELSHAGLGGEAIVGVPDVKTGSLLQGSLQGCAASKSHGAPAGASVHGLRSSVAALHALVQARISAQLRASHAVGVGVGAAAENGQTAGIACEPSATVLMGEPLVGGDSMLEVTAFHPAAACAATSLDGTLGLLGAGVQLGSSSDLLGGGGSQVLGASDLEYLAALGGLNLSGHTGLSGGGGGEAGQVQAVRWAEEAEGWYDAQHVEAGEPLGTGQWGDHQPFGHQQVGGGAVADGAALVCTSHAPARDSVPQAGSAHTQTHALQLEAHALFDSLRQLHALMSGPRGHELSPRAQFKPEGGFTPPCLSPARLAHATSAPESDLGPSAAVNAPLLPASEHQPSTSPMPAAGPHSRSDTGGSSCVPQLRLHQGAEVGTGCEAPSSSRAQPAGLQANGSGPFGSPAVGPAEGAEAAPPCCEGVGMPGAMDVPAAGTGAVPPLGEVARDNAGSSGSSSAVGSQPAASLPPHAQPTPRTELVPSDVLWMADMMKTLSQSLGGDVWSSLLQGSSG